MVALLELDYGQLPVTTAAAFDQPDCAKLAVDFQLERLSDHIAPGSPPKPRATATVRQRSRSSHPTGI